MFVKTKYLALLGISATLSACGGGSTAPTSIEALNAPAPSQAAQSQTASFRTVSLNNKDGLVKNQLEIQDWSYNATLNSLNSRSQIIDYNQLSDPETVRLIDRSITDDGSESYVLKSYVGKPSAIGDVSQHVGARFKGTTKGAFAIHSSIETADFDGTSEINLSGTNANMTADVVLSGLKSPESVTTVDLGFDTLTVSDMALTGTTLRGADIVVTKNGQPVQLIGSDTHDDALAQFYGDGAKTLAGHIVTSNELGFIKASFQSELQK